jgi:hypothetical protein
VLDDGGVAACDDRRLTEPCDRFANVVYVLARVGDDEVTRLGLSEFHSVFVRDERVRRGCPCSIPRIDLAVVDRPDSLVSEHHLGHAVAPDKPSDVSKLL